MTEGQAESFNDYEYSSSCRILKRVVRIVKPSKYAEFSTYCHIMRWVDNLVDEGTSFKQAQEVITNQRRFTNSLLSCNTRDIIQTPDTDELKILASSIPHPLKVPFLRRWDSLLDYYQIDLIHRFNLTPYSQTDLAAHHFGGFTSWFAGLKIILNGQDLSGDPNFLNLALAHGQSEPLGDIAEDLEQGLVLHSKEDGAGWVECLIPGGEVPYADIDSYVVSRRGKLAKRIFKLAPAAYREFGGIIGLLATLDYYKRVPVIANRRFIPKRQVIFAKNRMLP